MRIPRFQPLVRNVVFVVSGYTGHGLARALYNQQWREKAMGHVLGSFPRALSSNIQICRGHSSDRMAIRVLYKADVNGAGAKPRQSQGLCHV